MSLKIEVLNETLGFVRPKKFFPIEIPNRYQIYKIWDPISNGLRGLCIINAKLNYIISKCVT